ncbi:MAG TPA: SprT family zinc-dependent metalloprotease [Beijerinckiaceae bacterium]|nr:SprT family zinc-dependent metalloprotease [Beijerinckiaceae bacterium]
MFDWPPSFFRKRPAKPRIERLEVLHLGRSYPVAIRRNATARRLILRVRADTGEAVLTLPRRTNMSQARDFLDRHGGWLAARMARLPEAVAFEPGCIVPFRGLPHVIEHAGSARGGVECRPGVDGDPGRLIVAGDPRHLARRLTDFFKREARAELARASAAYARQLNVRITRISIKDTRSRWGSCSATGALSFSWRLILAPPEVLDYLAAHEVAHRVELNHSPRYWAVVARLCPHWQSSESWLTRHGAGLHRFGASDAATVAPLP